MVSVTPQAGIVPHLGRQEAERLQQYYLGPEHLLLGLLVQGDNPAAGVLRAHGLDLGTVRAEVDRLIDQGVLPGPQPSDAELLATLGVDLEEVYGRLKEAFGWEAYYSAAQQVQLRPTQAVSHTPMSGTPLTCRRALRFACDEAVAGGQELGPLQLLLGLLRDAQDPVGTDLYPQERRQRAYLGLLDHGPHPVRLLVEARGLTLEALREAVRSELDRDQ
jgi:Clp amino terminal domain, pathogenicity island component